MSTFVEEAYEDQDGAGTNVEIRECPDNPTAPNCAGYIPLTCGDSVAGTEWCIGAECPSCGGPPVKKTVIVSKRAGSRRAMEPED